MNLMCSEMQELIGASRRYLAGEIALTDLRAVVVQAELSDSVKDDVNLSKSLLELRQLLDQTWNEWGLSRNALPRSEFDVLLGIQVESWRDLHGSEARVELFKVMLVTGLNACIGDSVPLPATLA